jgi:hypothetical protein
LKKPKLLLLDSDIIINCHKLGVWEAVKAKYAVHVTSIVVEEVKFAKTPTGYCKISLDEQAELTIVEATASEIAGVLANFANSFAQGLDDGETESLAVMCKGELEDCRFCTSDTNAIQAVGMLGLASQSISLEEVLEFAGIRAHAPGKLAPHLSKKNREHQVKVGSDRRISGEYFNKSPLVP